MLQLLTARSNSAHAARRRQSAPGSVRRGGRPQSRPQSRPQTTRPMSRSSFGILREVFSERPGTASTSRGQMRRSQSEQSGSSKEQQRTLHTSHGNRPNTSNPRNPTAVTRPQTTADQLAKDPISADLISHWMSALASEEFEDGQQQSLFQPENSVSPQAQTTQWVTFDDKSRTTQQTTTNTAVKLTQSLNETKSPASKPPLPPNPTQSSAFVIQRNNDESEIKNIVKPRPSTTASRNLITLDDFKN